MKDIETLLKLQNRYEKLAAKYARHPKQEKEYNELFIHITEEILKYYARR